jgi:hypothetical protein
MNSTQRIRLSVSQNLLADTKVHSIWPGMVVSFVDYLTPPYNGYFPASIKDCTTRWANWSAKWPKALCMLQVNDTTGVRLWVEESSWLTGDTWEPGCVLQIPEHWADPRALMPSPVNIFLPCLSNCPCIPLALCITLPREWWWICWDCAEIFQASK